MRAIYYSKADGFHERDRPPAFSEWDENEDSLELFMELGYEQSWVYGDGHQACDFASAWINVKGISPKYIVEIHDVTQCQTVFVEDLPSFLTLRLQLATAMSTSAVVSDIQEMQIMIEKLFRVSHRHHPQESCRECDPDSDPPPKSTNKRH